MSDESLERALREIKRAGLERAIVGRLLAEMSDEDVSSLAQVGAGLLSAIERARTDVGRASSRGPCAHCVLPVCYCCPECGREVTEHAPDYQSDPARQGATT